MPTATSPTAPVVSSIVDLIGNTPLIRLAGFEAGLPNVELYAKAEWKNPGGSVKDRPAARMVLDGERAGALTKDKILLDATSGNTGIAYAMIGASRGYRVRLCMPENVTPERKKVLRAFGAEVVFTSPMEGSDGAITTVRELHAKNPELYFYPDQYNNDSNWRAHYDTTGPEIIEQTKGRITHFVAGLGTGGTLMGTGRALRLPQARRFGGLAVCFPGRWRRRHRNRSGVPARTCRGNRRRTAPGTPGFRVFGGVGRRPVIDTPIRAQ